MPEIQGNLYNHHRVAAAANCIEIGSKFFVSDISVWSQFLFETILIFFFSSIKQVEPLQASSHRGLVWHAGLCSGLSCWAWKRACSDLYAKAGVCEEVCESVRVTVRRLANTATVRMRGWVFLYVCVSRCVRVCKRACEHTYQSRTKH